MSDLIDPEIQQRFRGAKLPLKPMHIWGMRVRLQVEKRWRDLALLDVAIDSKLRGRTWWRFELPTYWPVEQCAGELLSYSKRLDVPCSLRSLTRRACRSRAGWSNVVRDQRTGCFRAG